MISRQWTGLCMPSFANDYIEHLKTETFPHLHTLNGFIRAEILKRGTAQGVEFLVITVWDSIDAIKLFAGPSPEVAVVPKAVKNMMIKYDFEVRHYEIEEFF